MCYHPSAFPPGEPLYACVSGQEAVVAAATVKLMSVGKIDNVTCVAKKAHVYLFTCFSVARQLQHQRQTSGGGHCGTHGLTISLVTAPLQICDGLAAFMMQ